MSGLPFSHALEEGQKLQAAASVSIQDKEEVEIRDDGELAQGLCDKVVWTGKVD